MPEATAATDVHPARLGWIALFGLVGVFMRYLVNVMFMTGFKTDPAWSTIIINVVGSILIGVTWEYGAVRNKLDAHLRVGILVGLFGGFTTFSGYALDTFKEIDAGRWWQAAVYVVLSPVLGVAGCIGVVYLIRAADPPAGPTAKPP